MDVDSLFQARATRYTYTHADVYKTQTYRFDRRKSL